MSLRQQLTAADAVAGRTDSLFARALGDDAGARTHGLSARLDAALDPALLQARFDAAVAALRAQHPQLAAAPMRLFAERVPHRADSAPALALCERELLRIPAPAMESSLRAVQFAFEDGAARIVLTASRAFAGKALLLRLLAHLVEGGGFEAMPAPAAGEGDGAQRDWRECPPLAAWAAPGQGQGVATLGPVAVKAGLEQLMPALARVLQAFTQQNAACVPVLIDAAPAAASGGGWALRDLRAASATDSDRARPARIDADAGAGETWLDDARLAAAWGSDAGFALGLVVADAAPLAPAGVRELSYRAFQRPPLPITLLVERGDDETLAISLHHDRAALGAADARWLLSCIANVARGLAAAPQQAAESIALLDQAEHGAVLALGRGGGERLASPLRIDARIAELAASQPGAAAVSDADGALSYAELEREAAHLAAALAARGVGRGDHVGLCLPRSRHLVTAALAVLKAGAVYVPIDPDYPAERIAYLCEDAALKLAICDDGREFDAPGATVLALSQWRATPAAPQWRPDPDCALDDPAYMIYTSGSTGRPKGVRVSHRSVQALLGAVERDFALTRADVWSFFHSFAFDFSVWEVWGALITGARVHVVAHATSRDPQAFIAEANAQGVSVLSQTPSAFGQLMAADRETPLGAQLRLVVFGGEALDARALLPWFDRHPESGCRLINMFGITETTVHVTAKDIRRIHALQGSRSVGRPIDGWRAYVLDAQGHVLPPGIDGEIYVAGSGVALGYHERPELNQQRFLPDLLGEGRMYRSGDRGRLLPDGELLHLGRLDNQIKLRGFRIELDEIRNVLLRCRGVEAAAALFSQRDKLDAATARIDAYVILADGHLKDVWQQAMQLLPEYMLPTSIARVSAMPLTANGKLDAKAIGERILEKSGSPERIATIAVAAGAGADAAVDESRPAPAADAGDEVERHLIEIWSELFDQPVGRSDNFFDLGGNSLFAIRLSSKARERGLPGLSLRDLYVHQTISGLSSYLSRN